VWTRLEDWIRRPAEPTDLHARIATLRALIRRNAPLHLDDDDAIVRRGSAWVALPAVELAVLRPLLARQDRVVSRGLLLAAARDEPGEYTTQMLDSTVQRLRKRLQPLGVTLHAVRGCGYLLELRETAT
jgi:DNA-binding response OmpR family regulator